MAAGGVPGRCAIAYLHDPPGCWAEAQAAAAVAAQAAAALDRERLRTQAAQAEALAEGNRMRTALLAAVSHDLRTPLASIKASVSTLRQTEVTWTAADDALARHPAGRGKVTDPYTAPKGTDDDSEFLTALAQVIRRNPPVS